MPRRLCQIAFVSPALIAEATAVAATFVALSYLRELARAFGAPVPVPEAWIVIWVSFRGLLTLAGLLVLRKKRFWLPVLAGLVQLWTFSRLSSSAVGFTLVWHGLLGPSMFEPPFRSFFVAFALLVAAPVVVAPVTLLHGWRVARDTYAPPAAAA